MSTYIIKIKVYGTLWARKAWHTFFSSCLEPFACKLILTNMYKSGLRLEIFTTDRSTLMKKLFRYNTHLLAALFTAYKNIWLQVFYFTLYFLFYIFSQFHFDTNCMNKFTKY